MGGELALCDTRKESRQRFVLLGKSLQAFELWLISIVRVFSGSRRRRKNGKRQGSKAEN